MGNRQKFKAPVFTHRPGGKNTDHSAASGWLANVVSAVKTGTPAALKRLTIAYHGVPPHMQDLNEPTETRPSVAPTEPQDVPDADDMVRTINAESLPIAAGGSMRRQQNPDLVFGKAKP
jgi:hypothetical protein